MESGLKIMLDPASMQNTLKRLFPGQSALALIRELLRLHYPLPAWSTLSEPRVITVKQATVGASLLCHGQGRIAVITRGETGPKGEPRYGIPGGYVALGGDESAGETLEEGAVRELGEEVLDNEGRPVIVPDAARLKLVYSGIDYRTPGTPLVYHSYQLALTDAECAVLIEYVAASGAQEYREAVERHSGGELKGFRFMLGAEASLLPRESFTHPHEWDAMMHFLKENA
jgi:ADP-ribose pyrophosphatase YjhB (NUDIX family)